MSIIDFLGHSRNSVAKTRAVTVPHGWSIEVMPRTAARIEDFRALLPAGTRVYVAHIAGTTIEDMVATARRLAEQGFVPMPHIPARLIVSEAMLADWLTRYRDEAGVREALLLAGGLSTPAGSLDSSIRMLETGLFDRLGFTRLHVAGHPEGNRDIDGDGSTVRVDEALAWKQDFSQRTDARMAIVTQFAFDAKAVVDWAQRIRKAGVTLPIHVGIAGPAKLQTLLKFAMSCGVGPSLKVLQKRASDLTKLLLPYEPTDIVADLAEHMSQAPDSGIEALHMFPLGGIQVGADWMRSKAPPAGSAERLASSQGR
jgi:methylenetetrahydrofolate reductase (NADPH)